LTAFRKTVCDHSEPHKTDVPARQRLLRHRRMAPIAGQ
jgi:hypothetical protein